ncbi:MAG TPA: peptide ABC transporter permease, partial [Thermoplasmata archaeon]|nr:peptide ABC transporter permease [Thermoplasmata archaeon]
WKMAGGVRQTIVDIIERGGRNIMVVLGFIVIIFMVIIAVLAPVLPMADPTELSDELLLPPSSDHWFGTDENGRDVFSRVVWGARVSLLVATLAVLVSMVIGIVLGLTAGYFGGKVDYIITGTIDLFWTFPPFLLAL